MKNLIKPTIFFVICFSMFSSYSFSQTITTDTTLANQYFDLAKKYENDSKFDSAIFYAGKTQVLNIKYFGERSIKNASILYQLGRLCSSKNNLDLALEYYFKAMQICIELLGKNHIDVASCYANIGLVFDNKGEYDKALEYHFKCLQIRKEFLGEKHPDVASCYGNIGLVYNDKGEYDKALEYHFKCLQIRKELLGENHPDVASAYENIGISYYFKGEYDKALEFYFKCSKIRQEFLGEKNSDVALIYNNIGAVYYDKAEYDKALEYFFKSLAIRKELLGEKHPDVAASYNNIGGVYDNKGEYDKALEYYFKCLEISKELFGEKHPVVARVYFNIGNDYCDKADYDKALEYYLKSLKIREEILGEKHTDIATTYNAIGNVYYNKIEFDKALEYYLKSLKILKELLGEKHKYVAESYNNIGNIYYDRAEYSKALEYYLKSLEIQKEVLGEKHDEVAWSYNSIGLVYDKKGEYDKAMEYCQKALQLQIEILGEKHKEVAMSFNNIGAIYDDKAEYDKALEYHQKALHILEEVLGEKHKDVAYIYNDIGNDYDRKNDENMALKYHQKAVASCLQNFKDTTNVYYVPPVSDILYWDQLLQALHSKAEILADKNKILASIANNDRKKIALRHYQACDTLIDITRKEISTQSDKLALGEKANKVYKEAIDLLTPLQSGNNAKTIKNTSDKDANLAFYFSEKNKSSVLLEALAGQEAQKYAGIPVNLMQKEHNLKIDIAFYTKQLAESGKQDSTKAALFQDKLFRVNRSYDSLIAVFEKQFPEYHNLKYNNKTVTVKEIQKLLDKKTAIISYVIGDSTITSFTLTRSNLSVQKVPKLKNLSDSIVWFRYGLTKTSLRMQETYRRLGYKLYQQLFPKGIIADKQIENLIIIPDGELAIVPFESFLTENYTGDINTYKEYPFLIKKYNISYSYSANLFHLTFSQKPASTIEITKLNDWLAFAPVFDNSGEQNMVMSSKELQRNLSGLKTDSTMINRSMFDMNYITPLPATETETESIFKIFDESNLKAKVLLHNNANEQFIKSGELAKYRVVHFATHGFINSEKPELSGLLLAQDTTGGEDGILYSGEIYNLKLNADLVVLSACETGLGKIQKGEGIIGLTRALLYAGAKNIIVSLWEVADESTSDLMVNFYKNSLAGKKQLSYSDALRNAKLKMISEGKYAHPLYWSPFILIGK